MATALTTPPANGTTDAQVARAPSREIRVVEDHGPLAHLFDTARFEQLYRIAQAMARAALIPDHLVGVKKGPNFTPYSNEQVIGNCFLVVNQSVRWGIDPFAAMAETYAIGGKLGFQGKLVAAVVNARAGLVERLRYEFSGEGENRMVTVIGRFEGESADRVAELTLLNARTDNQMWRKDPDQKLIYSAVTKWARRHCPEIMLGVLTDDDLERIEADRAKNPPKEVSGLGDLTQHLSAPPIAPVVTRTVPAEQQQETATDGPSLSTEESQVEDATAESEASQDPGEIAADQQDAFDSLSAKLDLCANLTSVNEVEKAAIAAGLDEKQVRTMCDGRRDEIREARGK